MFSYQRIPKTGKSDTHQDGPGYNNVSASAGTYQRIPTEKGEPRPDVVNKTRGSCFNHVLTSNASYQRIPKTEKSETHHDGLNCSRGSSYKHASEPNASFLESGLKTHNMHRAKHGVPPLALSKDLTDMAQAYAEQLAKTHKFEHSPAGARGGAGENIYGCTGPSPLGEHGERAVTSWYKEIGDYRIAGGKVTPEKYSHFSQVVWKATEELGMGVAGDNGWIIVVANYRPAGNLVGAFSDNVPPPV